MALVKKTARTAAPTKTTKVAAKKAPVAKASAAAPKTGAFGRPVGATTGAKRKAPARKRTPLPTFAAPEDFKPHFLLVSFQTDKDGLIGASIKAVRYYGRFDREAPEQKKFNLMDYDPQTLIGVAARMSAVTFKPSHERVMPSDPKARVGLKGSNRLPKTTVFEALVRVGKKSADGSLTARVASVFQSVKKTMKSGKSVVRPVELEKTDPASRMIRRVNRVLPAAFKNVLATPKRTRGSRNQEADDE